LRVLICDGDNKGYSFVHATQGNSPIIPGLMSMMCKLYRTFRPDLIIVAWEGHFSFRHKLVDDYKADRGIMQDKDFKAIVKARNVMRHFGIVQAFAHGFEADDVIMTLAERCGWLEDIERVIISTEDKDLYQCLHLPYACVESQKTKVGKTCNGIIDGIAFQNYFGFPPEYFHIYQYLVGDKCDNISGIKGIGPKKATNIIKEFVKHDFAPDIDLLVNQGHLPAVESHIPLKDLVRLVDNAPVRLFNGIEERVVLRLVKDVDELARMGRILMDYKQNASRYLDILKTVLE
jgi:5'-3' exonuclease